MSYLPWFVSCKKAVKKSVITEKRYEFVKIKNWKETKSRETGWLLSITANSWSIAKRNQQSLADHYMGLVTLPSV